MVSERAYYTGHSQIMDTQAKVVDGPLQKPNLEVADLSKDFKVVTSKLEARRESSEQTHQVLCHSQDKIEDAILGMNQKYEKLMAMMTEISLDLKTKHRNKGIEGSIVNWRSGSVICKPGDSSNVNDAHARGEFNGNERLPKIDLSLFEEEGPREWLMEARNYFQLHQISDELRLGIVGKYLEGKAYVWFYVFMANHPMADWSFFSEELCKRFSEMCIEEESQNNDGAGFLLDAKIETEIELEIGEREKFENKEVERVEPMEFQMVESNTKVSTTYVIDCKQRIVVELNDLETIEGISTSKTKMEFGNPIPTRPTVWLKDEKSGACNANQTHATLHYLLNPMVVKRMRRLLTSYKEDIRTFKP